MTKRPEAFQPNIQSKSTPPETILPETNPDSLHDININTPLTALLVRPSGLNPVVRQADHGIEILSFPDPGDNPEVLVRYKGTGNIYEGFVPFGVRKVASTPVPLDAIPEQFQELLEQETGEWINIVDFYELLSSELVAREIESFDTITISQEKVLQPSLKNPETPESPVFSNPKEMYLTLLHVVEGEIKKKNWRAALSLLHEGLHAPGYIYDHQYYYDPAQKMQEYVEHTLPSQILPDSIVPEDFPSSLVGRAIELKYQLVGLDLAYSEYIRKNEQAHNHVESVITQTESEYTQVLQDIESAGISTSMFKGHLHDFGVRNGLRHLK